MDQESEIVKLLTEIRDNQRAQMEFGRTAVEKQSKKLAGAAVMLTGAIILLILVIVLLK